MVGRKPKPIDQKIIEGTFRKDRFNDEQPIGMPLDEIPKCPVKLKKEIQQIWNDAADYLVRNKLLFPETIPLLIAYCLEWNCYFENLGTNRSYQHLTMILRIAAEMGISPMARMKIKTGFKQEQEDELTKILKMK